MNAGEKGKNHPRLKWPTPAYTAGVEPLFLFIATPPCSGSTALAKILCTSHKATLLQSRGEGQWLVPGLCEPDRWREDKYIDYESVKAVWLAQFQKRLMRNKELEMVVEKSPPNLVRFEPLINLFSRRLLLANNRDPFANCASRLYRKFDADVMDRDQRQKTLQALARSWVAVSRHIREIVNKHDIPLVTYEKFCINPAVILEEVPIPASVRETIDLDAYITVKDYAPAGIVNRNREQVALLQEGEIEILREAMHEEAELLGFFGYSLDDPGAVFAGVNEKVPERNSLPQSPVQR